MIKNNVQGCQAEEKIEVMERDLDCRKPRCGFARIRCPDCGEERLLMFSYRTRTKDTES
jgi:ribosomal protein S27E